MKREKADLMRGDAALVAMPLATLLPRGLCFLVAWIALMGFGPEDLPVGITAAAAATWASAALWPPEGRLSPSGIARFLMRFLMQSVNAGIDVARRACARRVDLKPGFVTCRSAVPAGMARDASCAVMSLQPGKLPVAVAADGTLLVHCLDLREPVAEQLAADEAAFCDVLARGGRDG